MREEERERKRRRKGEGERRVRKNDQRGGRREEKRLKEK